MEFFTDLKSRLPFRANSARSADPHAGHWHRLLESDQFLVLEIDRSGLIQSANAELCRVRDAALQDVLGTSLFYLINAEDRPAFNDLVRDVFYGHSGTPILARLLTNTEIDPSVRWSMFPILDEQGAVVTVLCIGADLTPHLEASARREAANEALTALRQSNALLEQENLALRQERDRHAAAAKAAAQARATELANDSGPIPGLEDHHSSTPTLAQLERRYIIHTLEETRGRVSGAKGAAAILGLHPNTLRSRMEKLGIARVS